MSRRGVSSWTIRGLGLSLLLAATVAEAASTDGKQGLLALGSEAPEFRLSDVVSGRTVSLEDFAGKKALLVMIICRHCPYVQHVKQGMARLAKDYADKSLGIVAISSNDISAFPEDAPEGLKEMAQEAGFSFPVCYDERQQVAKAYTAVATPDFFLFDAQRRLVYRGQFDASRPGKLWVPVTGRDVRAAIDAVLAGRPVPQPQKPSFGCSIKWKPGHEPPYL